MKPVTPRIIDLSFPALLATSAAAALSLWPAPSHAQTGVSTVGLDCLIQPSQTVQIGTATAGVIEAVRVERGDYVKRGQVVVQLESKVERAALAVAREKAQQLGEVQATRGASDLAKRELDRAADLLKENFVSRTYYDRQRAELTVASGRGQQAEEKRRLALREVQLAAAQLEQRTVASPIDGVVVERHVGPGEYVDQKPVLRIAQVDPLRVDVLVPAAAFGRIEVGSKAQVMPELLTRQAHTAVVSGVDRVIDAASNTFRVRLELPNPEGKVPPGLRCKADLVALTAPPPGQAKGNASAKPAAPANAGAGAAAPKTSALPAAAEPQRATPRRAAASKPRATHVAAAAPKKARPVTPALEKSLELAAR